MKKKKIVKMVCPSCKREFGEEPIIRVNPLTGAGHMERRLLRKCTSCSTNLVRRVTLA